MSQISDPNRLWNALKKKQRIAAREHNSGRSRRR